MAQRDAATRIWVVLDGKALSQCLHRGGGGDFPSVFTGEVGETLCSSSVVPYSQDGAGDIVDIFARCPRNDLRISCRVHVFILLLWS